VAAVRNVDAALDGCAECWTILRTSAVIIARAGQFERAEALLERAQRVGPYATSGEDIFATLREAVRWRTAGPSNPILREVGFYSALGAFGRAYRTARPVMSQPDLSPGSINALAELAALAGDMSMARSLLRRVYSEADADTQLAALFERVPWRDQPKG
jgi:Flp pilus assembly protein TadD